MYRVRVNSRPYFTGITSRLVPPQIQHKFLQARKANGIWQQRTLRNKKFNIHNKTGMKINEKHNVRVVFVEIQLWSTDHNWKMKIGLKNENRVVHTCVCVCVCVCLYVNKIYQINGSMVGRSKLDKNNCLYLHMWVCVCIWMMDRTYGYWLSFSPHVFFLRFWRQHVALIKESRMPFLLSLFWLEEMKLWPWKEWIEWLNDRLTGWLNSSLFIL